MVHPRKLINIYNMSDELKARVVASAQQDRRSMSLQIQVLLEEALATRGAKAKEE